ncbi:C-C motif chemokine 25 [Octodon degus]|uniref:C-C motif chemokine 25 n=1 Tax=Octodon degus TaxID=10160 RepID=A0A6P3FFQ4_OCTDE|nr:C-C motif chemokine 25 [Octodon degus]
MSPWLLACLVAFFAGAWVPAVHPQGISEDCCLAYSPHLKQSLFRHLRHVRNFYWQDVSGSCNLHAVIFQFQEPGRVVCGDPQNKWVRKAVELLSAQKKRLREVSNGTALPGGLPGLGGKAEFWSAQEAMEQVEASREQQKEECWDAEP